MNCPHLWLPARKLLYLHIVCARCHEDRRICFRGTIEHPTISSVAREAEVRGIT